MRRIYIVGTSGSGKSTLAKYLAAKLGLKHIELDAIQWLPDWQKRSPEEFMKLLDKELSQATHGFVMDGNFTQAEVIIQANSDLIFLDYPRITVFGRILKRSIKRVATREELWAGNREELKFLLSLNPDLNPVLWSWKSHHKRVESYNSLINTLLPEVRVHRVKSKSELKRLKALFTN